MEKKKRKNNLKVIDVFSIVDSAHVLHEYVQLTASFPSYVDSYGLVSFKNPDSHLKEDMKVMIASFSEVNKDG